MTSEATTPEATADADACQRPKGSGLMPACVHRRSRTLRAPAPENMRDVAQALAIGPQLDTQIHIKSETSKTGEVQACRSMFSEGERNRNCFLQESNKSGTTIARRRPLVEAPSVLTPTEQHR